jgi:crossover junction endodeoxyribonuclease RusA
MGDALYEDSAMAEPAAESWGHGSFWNSSASRTVHFEVSGLPIAQGSMRAFVVKGKPVITSTSRNLNQWRQLVALRANEVRAKPFEGPVIVELNFRLPKPKSAPKRKRSFATKRPDLDKLIRSVLDALTHVLFRDDSQVVQITALKDYGPPGVTVSVTEIVR